jgi:hypothetical protein
MFSRSFFGERVEEHGAGPGPVSDQHAVAAGGALPATGDPLLDDAAAQIGVDRSVTAALDRLSQAAVRLSAPGAHTAPFIWF